MPIAFWIVFALFAGLIAGSYATAVAYRVPRGIGTVMERSACPACGAQIAAYDNVPVFGWLLLRGRARCCGAAISPRYPLTELAVGLLFAATALVYRHEPGEAVLGCVFVTMLAAITLTDLEQRLIPNKILLWGSLVGVAVAAVADPGGFPERAIAAAAGGGLMFLVVLAYPKGMGLGDVKLVAAMGLFLGRALAPAVLIALLAGSVVGIAMIVRHGSEARKRAIPFGPFLALGGVIAMLAGDQLIDLYLG
ncbi:MAG TPA: prepilin peptidase [Solirubrobacterales bacterium]|nr:prepilin peptidase [Solirubrobacterales bacterium]